MRYGGGYQVRIGPNITPTVKALIIANALAFLWQILAGSQLLSILGLTPYLVWSQLFFWQLGTYLFLHGDFWHILINMFTLWMFGSELERAWGSREFFKFFLVTGIGAGVFSVMVDPFSTIPIIGASGAVYGILMAYGMMFPERYVYLYFLFPIKVKYMVAGLAILVFLSALGSPGGPIAHFAHLGGMLLAFLYLKGWLNPSTIRQNYYRWKLKRMRRRFEVYDNKDRYRSRSRDDDFYIH